MKVIQIYIALLLFLIVNNIIKAATEEKFSVAFSVEKTQYLDSISPSLKQAELYFENGQTEIALKLYLKTLEKAKKQKNINTLYECNFKISKIFRSINNFEKAMFYAKKSLKYSTITRDTIKLINSYQNIGIIHYDFYISDHVSHSKSLDSLFIYSDMVSKTINNNHIYKTQIAKHQTSIAVAYFHEKNYQKAHQHIQNALNAQITLKDTIGQVLSYNTIASNYLKRGKYKKAEENYKKSLQLIEKSTSKRRGKLSRMIYSNLAWTYYKTKDYIAYDYLRKANEIADTLRTAEFDAIITEIEAKHNVDIIKQNAAKQQLIETEEKKQFQTISVGLSVSLLILVLIFWIYSKNAKLKDENKDLLIVKTRLMKEKQIEYMEAQTRIKILNATLDGKEAERKQIAETLHDSVSALLSAANLHLQASKNQIKGVVPIEINKTQKIIDEASGKIRNLSHKLISSVLLKFGLSYAIQDFCEKYSNTQLEISSYAENLQRYEESFEIKTNNIIEELVNNLIKHSEASEGHVSVMEYKKSLHVEIQDNGKGFDTTKKIESNGIGIHQIEARIKMMNGYFKIHSKLGEGTKIEFTIPITYKTAT